MSQSTPVHTAVSPSTTELIAPNISDLNLSDPRFQVLSDAIKAASDTDDSLSEEERAALAATKLKLKHEAYLLALTVLEELGIAGLLQGFQRLAALFEEIDLQKQVSFMKAMDLDLRKRFEDTRRKIDNMELTPDPMTDLLTYLVNAFKIFQTCTWGFEGMTTTLCEYRQEKLKLVREWQNRLLLPCGSSARGPSITDYDFAMRKFALMQRTWSKLQKYKMDLDPSEGMKLLGLGDEWPTYQVSDFQESHRAS